MPPNIPPVAAGAALDAPKGLAVFPPALPNNEGVLSTGLAPNGLPAAAIPLPPNVDTGADAPNEGTPPPLPNNDGVVVEFVAAPSLAPSDIPKGLLEAVAPDCAALPPPNANVDGDEPNTFGSSFFAAIAPKANVDVAALAGSAFVFVSDDGDAPNAMGLIADREFVDGLPNSGVLLPEVDDVLRLLLVLFVAALPNANAGVVVVATPNPVLLFNSVVVVEFASFDPNNDVVVLPPNSGDEIDSIFLGGSAVVAGLPNTGTLGDAAAALPKANVGAAGVASVGFFSSFCCCSVPKELVIFFASSIVGFTAAAPNVNPPVFGAAGDAEETAADEDMPNLNPPIGVISLGLLLSGVAVVAVVVD